MVEEVLGSTTYSIVLKAYMQEVCRHLLSRVYLHRGLFPRQDEAIEPFIVVRTLGII